MRQPMTKSLYTPKWERAEYHHSSDTPGHIAGRARVMAMGISTLAYCQSTMPAQQAGAGAGAEHYITEHGRVRQLLHR